MFSLINFYKSMIRLLKDDRIMMTDKKSYISYMERQLQHLLRQQKRDTIKFEYRVILDLR